MLFLILAPYVLSLFYSASYLLSSWSNGWDPPKVAALRGAGRKEPSLAQRRLENGDGFSGKMKPTSWSSSRSEEAKVYRIFGQADLVLLWITGWTQVTNSFFSWHLVPWSLVNLYLDCKTWIAQPEQFGTSHALYSDGSTPLISCKKPCLLTFLLSRTNPLISGWIDMFGWSLSILCRLVQSRILLAFHPITFISGSNPGCLPSISDFCAHSIWLNHAQSLHMEVSWNRGTPSHHPF